MDAEGSADPAETERTAVSKTYAIADLHGRHDLLIAAINAVADIDQGPLTFITLGDYIDRGPESRQVIETLMALRDDPPGDWKVVCLMGNHEDIMIQTLTAPLKFDWWRSNGGGATLISYGHAASGIFDPTVVPVEHVAWVMKLPLLYVDEHRVFVHAWVDSSVPLDKQKPDKMMWELYPPNARYGHRLTGRHVVHGHHQFADGPKLYRGRTDLDVFAWSTGRLVIGVFDDEAPGGPVDLIEVRGAGDWRSLKWPEVESA